MEALQARLDTFLRSKRAKGSTKASGSGKWPHPVHFKATPDTLAEAGFYFNPSAQHNDNVTCFMCGKELSDWDADDDPFEIHWDKCPTCPWAIVRCGILEDIDESGNFRFLNPTRLPTCADIQNARLATFTYSKTWPHDGKRGHGAQSKKMAKAGFVYTPQSSGDDTASCLYCNTALSGWESDDDPLEEHRKRGQKTQHPCVFLSYVDRPAAPVATLAKSTSKPPSKSSSRQPSRSAQTKRGKNDIAASEELPTEESEDELAATLAGPSNGDVSKTKKSAGSRASSIAKTPAPRRATRGTGTNGKASDRVTLESEEDEGGRSEHDAGKRVTKAKRQGQGKGKGRITVIAEEEERSENDDVVVIVPVELAKPKRGRPAKDATKVKPRKKTPTVEDPPFQPAPIKLAHTRTRSRANLESESDVPGPSNARPVPAKNVPPSKTNSKHAPLSDIAEPPIAATGKGSKKKAQQEDSEPPSDAPQRSSKPKARVVSRAKSKKVKVIESDSEEEHTPFDEVAGVDSQAGATPKVLQGKVATVYLSDDKTPKRKSSTTSDDAGYATAELPPDADSIQDDSDAVYLTGRSTAKSKHGSSNRTSQANSHQRLGPTLETHRQSTQPSKLESDAEDPRPTVGDSRISPEAEHSKHLHQSRAVARASLSRSINGAGAGRSRASQDIRNVVEISSDGEEEQQEPITKPDTSPTDIPIIPDVQHPRLSRGKTKMEVEIVLQEDHHYTSSGDMASAQGANLTPELGLDEVPSDSRQPSTPPSTPPTHSSMLSTPMSHAAPSLEMEVDQVGKHPADASTPFRPFLALIPMHKLTTLTEEESSMSIEQFIRREIETQYQLFQEDGEREIATFKEKAAETRTRIEAL